MSGHQYSLTLLFLYLSCLTRIFMQEDEEEEEEEEDPIPTPVPAGM